jgi:nitrite reductase/ring-hydroxylating ferredoxin subunit
VDRVTQLRIFEEIRSYCAAGSTKLAPAEMRYPAQSYYNADFMAAEKAMLCDMPQIVGHVDELPNPGDFISHADCGVPILVTRQRDLSVKAFLNICPHRGANVCSTPSGNAASFSCPFHGWTFRNDGKLLAAPRDGFPTLNREAFGLTEISVEERHGLIWVVTRPGGTIDVAAHLGNFDAELESFGMSDQVLQRAEVVDVDINWKFVIDGFIEVYHFARLHEKSIAPWFYGTHSPYDADGINGRLIGVRKSFDTIKNRPFDDIDLLPHIAVNYQIFPNTVGVWQGDHFEFWTAYPGATPDSCRVRIQSITPRALSGPEFRSRWERNWKIMIETVQNEDWAISRIIQKNLPFAHRQDLIAGANEPGLQHFHHTLVETVSGYR